MTCFSLGIPLGIGQCRRKWNILNTPIKTWIANSSIGDEDNCCQCSSFYHRVSIGPGSLLCSPSRDFIQYWIWPSLHSERKSSKRVRFESALTLTWKHVSVGWKWFQYIILIIRWRVVQLQNVNHPPIRSARYEYTTLRNYLALIWQIKADLCVDELQSRFILLVLPLISHGAAFQAAIIACSPIPGLSYYHSDHFTALTESLGVS